MTDSFAQALLDNLAPMLYADAENGSALQYYVEGLGTLFQIVEDWASDTDTAPGWSLLIDVDRCPDEALPWLAQFTGSVLPVGISADDQRDLIRSATRWKRGTPGALVGAPAPFLTGSKTVVFRERYDPDDPAVDHPYYLYVITYTDETSDPLLVANALMSQKPGGIILNYVVHSGQDYTSLRTNYPSYSAVKTAYATYQGVNIDEPGA